jgi:hypothetical protein
MWKIQCILYVYYFKRKRRETGWREEKSLTLEQIGFLTEWQMYAQKLEGDEWIGERMDIGKIDKMSGKAFGS